MIHEFKCWIFARNFGKKCRNLLVLFLEKLLCLLQRNKFQLPTALRTWPTYLNLISHFYTANSYSISYYSAHCAQSVTTWWLNSDGAVTVVNCRQYGTAYTQQLVAQSVLPTTTVITSLLSGHHSVTMQRSGCLKRFLLCICIFLR